MKHRYQIRAFETEDGHFETENFSQKKIPRQQKHPVGLPMEQDGAGWQVEPVPEPERPEKKRMKKRRTKASRKKEPKKRRPFFRKKPQEPEVPPLDSGAFTVPDILAPASTDLGHRDYVEVDGVFHTYFYITGYGYPSTVGGGWLCPVIESGEGINVSFTFTKQPREKTLSKIAHTTMLNRSRMREIGDTRQDYEEVDGAIDAGLYLKNEMNRDGEDFYYMTTLIEVHGEDLETMEQRAAWLETRCTALGMTVRRCDYRNEEGFLSALPLLSLDPDIERKGRRNVLTSGVAASFPFSSFEICDQTGVMLGINQHNRSVCMLDIFDSAKYSNGNMCVMGMSGAGKSFLMQLMALRYRQQGVQVFLLCPLKGHELRPACEAIGGKYIKLSPTSKDCINIMEIRRSTLDTDSRLGRLAERGDSLLADKISKLHIFFSLLKSNITEEEKQYLDPALVECYRRFGITFDNASLRDEDGSPRAMPDLHDLYDLLQEQPETKSLAVALARFATGSAANMGQQTNVDLQKKYIVLDISELPSDLVSVGMFMALDFCWDKCKESRVEKKLLMLFELWTLIGSSSSPIAANFVLEIVKIIRGYGGAMVGETQDCHDYFALGDGQYGRAILSNSRIKIVLPMEEEEAMFTQKVLGLSDEETLQIIRNRRGEGLLCAGHNRISVAFQPTPTEYDMITTSRQDLERQMMQHQREDKNEPG